MIVGDVGAGKTALTAELLDEAIRLGFRTDIVALDLAPTVELSSREVGRNLADFSQSIGLVRYLRVLVIRAPRLEGGSRGLVLELAEANAETIDPYLSMLIREPSPILFINDLTLYLQAGDVEKIMVLLEKAETAIVNAYRGRRLREDHGSGVSEREERALKSVEKMVDRVIELPLKREWKRRVYTVSGGD